MAPDNRVTVYLERNQKFASDYTRPPYLSEITAQRPPPLKPIAIISCIDPRLTPYEYFGLTRGEAAVVLNAGGRAADALKHLMVLETLAGGIETVIIVHHTDCGLTHLSDEDVRTHVREMAPSKVNEINDMEFGEIKDMEKSVRDDLNIVKSSPYLKITNVHGYVFDLEHGTLQEVTT